MNTDDEPRYYFWNGRNIVMYKHMKLPFTEIDGMLCVDTYYPAVSSFRYGTYSKVGNWSIIPISDFPEEFRTILLIQGIA